MEGEIFNYIIENIDGDIRNILSVLPSRLKENAEEIRLRVNNPLCIYSQGKDYFINSNTWSNNPKDGFIVGLHHLNRTFQLVCNYSVYALEEEIRNGYITIKGGHRVGIGGKIIYGMGGIESIKDISSLNFRIGREKKNISDEIIKHLISRDEFLNTLLISPPQCGKTTLLRDIVRNLSNGMKEDGIRGFKIGLVDERSEVAGVCNGVPQKDVGIRTDILDSCPKHKGIMMLIRSMSPEIIAVDEIGSSLDSEAIFEALKAGVKVIATIHGYSIEDIKSRSSMMKLFQAGVFKRLIVLDNNFQDGNIREIVDENTGMNLLEKRPRYAVI